MNRDSLPSVSALLAFESAGRHNSITCAASELNLTQSAVSRQIQQLEAQLGVRLFRRFHQRVCLTDVGRVYLKEVGEALEHLDAATRRTTTRGSVSMSLSLAVSSSVGSQWLIPRLPEFVSENPGVSFSFVTRACPFDFARESLDGAIYTGNPEWPGGAVSRLMQEVLIPVCCPGFFDVHSLRHAADLTDSMLLHHGSRRSAWADWFRQRGTMGCSVFRGLSFDQDVTLAQAAVSGLGIALLPDFIVEADLQKGTLVEAFEHSLALDQYYFFAVPEAKPRSPLIQRFSKWIAKQSELRRSAKVKLRTA